MRERSYKFHRPDIRPYIFVVGYTLLLFFVLESCLHIPEIVSRFPAPSPGLSYSFPEVGLKYQRYFAAKDINCLFFGSSMVDQGLDPEIIENLLNSHKNEKIRCFNFGLSGAMAENSSDVLIELVDRQKTDLIIFGLSPIEFDENVKKSRSMTSLPVFEESSSYSIEKSIFSTYRLPWFYYGFINRKDDDFIITQKGFNSCLNARGLCSSGRKQQFILDSESFYLHDFHPNQTDMAALQRVVAITKERNISIVFVEMPVKPSFFPNLIEGGETMYEQRFIKPIETFLETYDIPFLRTQKMAATLFADSCWRNENHLNQEGARVLSEYVASQIVVEGYW